MAHLMENDDLFSGLIWHLQCMELAAAEIDQQRPPADLFQMRMHYSLYIVNLMSAVDMVAETCGSGFSENLADEMKMANASGADVVSYLRELRNSIIHRATDPTSEGSVVEGRVVAMAPRTVYSRNGRREIYAPCDLLRDLLIHCDNKAKPAIEDSLRVRFDTAAIRDPKALLDEAFNHFGEASHIPEWAKSMVCNSLTPEMLMLARVHRQSTLRDLLKPRDAWRNE